LGKVTTFQFQSYRLRDPAMGDAAGVFELTNDPEVMRYYGLGGSFLKSIEAARSEIEWFRSLPNKFGRRWVICKTGDKAYLGDIGVFDFSPVHNRVELGFKLRKEHWGQGIITAFVQQILTWGFREHEYNRIQAYVEPGNLGCKRVLQKNGFRCEGVLREYEQGHAGFTDVELHSILRWELPASQE